MTNAPAKFELSGRAKGLFIVLVVIGIISFIVGLNIQPQRAWANFLLDFFFWLSIGLAGIFFSALQFISGARWSVTVRRVSETLTAYLPVALILFLVLLFGLHTLYEWTHHDVVNADPVLSMKKGYLNTPFFIIRMLFLFALCFLMGGKMIRNSLRQDQDGDPRHTISNTRLSAPFLILFAIAFTLVSFDLLMSLSPHWFSTIFGVYCWSGLFTSGLAMMAIWVIFLRKQGVLSSYVTDDHLHDIGKLMFAFLVFWGYIAFCQYMLIWYANLPEETFYFITRTKGEWKSISIALMLVKFVIPFFLLISRPAKRNENWLLFMAFWFLGAQWLDLYWIVFPTFFEVPVFGWMEVGIFMGFTGLFCLSVGYRLTRVNVVAYKDPWLHEALHHHQ